MINYYLLTKPGIIFGNLITFAAAFLMASKGTFHIQLFFWSFLGLAFIMASACVLNNYIDIEIDKKMERTKTRGLVMGIISGKQALLFSFALGAIGSTILLVFTQPLTFIIASLGFFIYIILYSLWKGKTIYGTAIGSIAGAIPPLVGYCAVTNQLDLGAFILFSMLVLWQMPHFFAIAIYHLEDYKAAGIPVLPAKKGIYRTKIHMVAYIIAFILASIMLTVYSYTGYIYLTTALFLNFSWLILCIEGFYCKNEQVWGRRMFAISLIVIISICFVIPFDLVQTYQVEQPVLNSKNQHIILPLLGGL